MTRWLPGIRRAAPTRTPSARVKELYNSGITDEFIPPFTVVDDAGQAVGPIRDNDVVINFNYRADRARQITRVLARNSGPDGERRAGPAQGRRTRSGDSAQPGADRTFTTSA